MKKPCTSCGSSDEAFPAIPVSEIGNPPCAGDPPAPRARCAVPPARTCVPPAVYPVGYCSTCYSDPCGCNVNYSNQSCIPTAPRPCTPTSKDVFARVDNAFSYPDVGYSAQVQITNVHLTDGQPISHQSFGTLIVRQAFAEEEDIYLLENRAELLNDITYVGRPVNCGTEFYLGYAAPDDTSALAFGCNPLLADFYIPALNATSPAQVQSFSDFTVGSEVLIRSKAVPSIAHRFTLSSISGLDTLILENTGDGGTAGTRLYADGNKDGESDWCVEPLTALNACAQASETQCITHLLGCDENGNIRFIQGSNENEAPVYDRDCGGYTNRLLPKTTKCVTLSTCFQIPITGNACDRAVYTITTTDDQALLDEAQDVLLSDNAEPQILICDYVFSMNLAESAVGAILVTPIFNNAALLSFDNNCRVCIPEDCCFQCNPQVIYPVDTLIPPGKSTAIGFAIPTTILQAAGEYKFSLRKNPDETLNYLYYHDSASSAIVAAYNEDGSNKPLVDLPGNDTYTYQNLFYCNQESACPVEGVFESDINVRFTNLPDKMLVSMNYFGHIGVYPCDTPGVAGTVLSTTQFTILRRFTGPTVLSAIAMGTDLWGIPSIAGQVKPYDAESGYNRRSFTLFYPNCVVVEIVPYILIKVDAAGIPPNNDFLYGSIESVSMFSTRII